MVSVADRFGPEILEIKGQILHRVRVHLKVPGWLSDLKELLNRKLPMFLLRLNEISGGREKLCLVSGSLGRILKFLRMTFLTARFRGWQVRVNGICSVIIVVRYLDRFLGLDVSLC